MIDDRISKFLTYIQSNGFYGGVSWFQNEWHISVTTNESRKIAYEHDFNLDDALNNVIKTLRNAGII